MTDPQKSSWIHVAFKVHSKNSADLGAEHMAWTIALRQ